VQWACMEPSSAAISASARVRQSAPSHAGAWSARGCQQHGVAAPGRRALRPCAHARARVAQLQATCSRISAAPSCKHVLDLQAQPVSGPGALTRANVRHSCVTPGAPQAKVPGLPGGRAAAGGRARRGRARPPRGCGRRRRRRARGGRGRRRRARGAAAPAARGVGGRGCAGAAARTAARARARRARRRAGAVFAGFTHVQGL